VTELLAKIKKQWKRIAAGVFIVLLFLLHASQAVRLGFIDQMELLAYDARLLMTMPGDIDPRIVIVDIDEESLAAEGQWPWRRDRLAEMLDTLFDHYKVSLVAFDIVFAEPDDKSGLRSLQELADGRLKSDSAFQSEFEQLREDLDFDARFAASMKNRPVILGYYFNRRAEGGTDVTAGSLPQPTFIKGSFQGKRIAFREAQGFGSNLAIFQEAAAGAGHFNPWLDRDGVVRRVPMLYSYEDQQYESLSLAVVRTLLGAKRTEPVYAPVPFGSRRNYSGLEWLRVGDRLVPVDEHLQSLVPYRGRQGSYPYVSAADVLERTADMSALEGGVILVGTTAPGLLDLRSAPVQNGFPGVEIHANLISGILENRIKENPAYTLGAEVAILAVVGIALALMLPLLTPLWANIGTLIALIFSIAANLAIWQFSNLVLPIASGLLLILFLFMFNMSYGYFVETRGKRQLTGLFGQYVPPELVDEMAADPESYSMEGESREMSVLFSDVRGFTTVSEGLEPRELTALMNEFLTPMTAVIHNYRGTIDKYMGDAIMAFWGAPLEDRDHARHAVVAGMEMIRRMTELDETFKTRGWPALRIGVGINTGVMNVGNMGSEFRMAYTVLGDAVNLGSRLEGLTKGYGVSIIVSEDTARAVPEYAYLELDRVRVKGKDKPVGIYQPLCLREQVSKDTKDELKLYREALKYYRSQNWDMAELQFLSLFKASQRYLYKMYAERVAFFRTSPPPTDWGGVFTHTTK
jgi:adenylate cyclase